MTRDLLRVLETAGLSEGQSFLVLSEETLRLDARLPTFVALPLSDHSKAALLNRYPADWRVASVTGGEEAAWGSLSDLPTEPPAGTSAYLYLPPLPWQQDLKDFRTLEEVVARLRAPDGCPWDKAQTHRSVAPYLLEETYEALEALDTGSTASLREELGDVLLQVMLHSQIAADERTFDVHEVVQGLVAKLVRRHPHVFGDATAKTAAEVAARWEVLKSKERNGASLMTGVPKALPALGYAQRVQERAANVGFDWPSVDGVVDKVAEEARELTAAGSQGEREHELGDVLFSLVNLGRRLGLDVESALRQSNMRFVRRFQLMEEISARRGLTLSGMALADKDRLWEEAKAILATEETAPGETRG